MLGVSQRSPESEVRSMPPTNATSSSTITSFSWWQCIVRSRASSAQRIRVPRVELVADPLSPSERVGSNTRRGRAGPHEHAHVDPLGQLGEQVAQRAASPSRSSSKRGVTCQPAMCTCERAAASASRDRRHRPLAVDQHLQRVAGARRRVAGRPQAAAGRRIEDVRVAELREPAAMVVAHLALEPLPDGAVERAR